jgi:hypothetical protein
MNPAFFQQVESILAQERLDAYRQDGAVPDITMARYLWNMALSEGRSLVNRSKLPARY